VTKIRLFAVLLGLIFSTLLINSHASAQVENQKSLAKISPWIIEQAKKNQSTDFLVVLADQADLSGAARLVTKEEKGAFVFNALLNKAKATQTRLLDWLDANGIEHQSFYIVNMIRVKGSLDVAMALAARPEVARIEGNPLIHNPPTPDVITTAQQPLVADAIEPGISYVRAPQVWAMGFTGQGIVIGGADTGYLWNHEALKSHYRGWDGTTANHNFNWHDSIHAGSSTTNPCGYDLAEPCDDNGHGTHTMGTAAGGDGAINQIGMAPGAKWIGCRNMDANKGTPARYAECFQFFLAPYALGETPAQGDPTKAPDVTTNSWTCPLSEGCNEQTWGIIQQAIQAQRAAGIVTVVAAGNSGSSCSTIADAPSFFPESFTVGALTTGTDVVAAFSGRGPVTIDQSNRMKPDITAPGTGTRSAFGSSISAYVNLSGTSMATPHVAGAVALMLSAQPNLRGQVDMIEGILKDSAAHILATSCGSSDSPNNVYGFGRLDVKAATDMALTVASPASLFLTATSQKGTLNVTAPAGALWTATTSDDWITFKKDSGAGSGALVFIVADNPSDQSRTGTITIARRSYTILQAGAAKSCSYTLSAASQVFSVSGGTGSFSLTTGDECVWNLQSTANWVTITSANSGQGGTAINFTVAPSTPGTTRKGKIKIAGQVFVIKQK
jgi:serine protease AprX